MKKKGKTEKTFVFDEKDGYRRKVKLGGPKGKGDILQGSWSWIDNDTIHWNFDKKSLKLARKSDMITGGYIDILKDDNGQPIYSSQPSFFSEAGLYYGGDDSYPCGEIGAKEGYIEEYGAEAPCEWQTDAFTKLYSYTYKDQFHQYINKPQEFAMTPSGKFAYDADAGIGEGFSNFYLLNAQTRSILATGLV